MTQKVKICHIAKAAGVAGSEKHLLTLLPGLDNAKYQVALVLLVEQDKPLDDFVGRFEGGGVRVRRVVTNQQVDTRLVLDMFHGCPCIYGRWILIYDEPC